MHIHQALVLLPSFVPGKGWVYKNDIPVRNNEIFRG
jgi:hypothetical protein